MFLNNRSSVVRSLYVEHVGAEGRIILIAPRSIDFLNRGEGRRVYRDSTEHRVHHRPRAGWRRPASVGYAKPVVV